MSSVSGVGEEWNQMFQPAENQEYMFPTSMSGGYETMHPQVEVKKEFDQGAVASSNYYVTPTSLGADGTLGPLPWNLDAANEDPLQLKGDRLVDFCFPGGIQDSLQEQQNNADLRACLTAENIRHFLDLFSNFQGHFPFLHMTSFRIMDAYDGFILAVICIGAVYSDRVSQVQVRGLMQRAKSGVERTSGVLRQAQTGDSVEILQSRLFASSQDLQEIQAILLLCIVFTWHGGPAERAAARSESKQLFHIVRRYRMFELIGPTSEGYSFLHHLSPGEQAPSPAWDWEVWINQERRLRLIYLVYSYSTALTLYFNCEPPFDPLEVKLPLPCDDAAWDAKSADECANALGLHGPGPQRATNQSGSLRAKQIEMHVAIKALYSSSTMFQPRTTNVYSKFILIHAIHTQIWQLQRELATGTPSSLDTLMSPMPLTSEDEHLYTVSPDHPASLRTSPDRSSASVTSPGAPAQPHQLVRSITAALVKWKSMWDQDMQLQYPPSEEPSATPRRIGFCRDGVHFYWLARAFLPTNRHKDWQQPADTRFKHVMSGLRQVREFGKSDAARRGEEPGSVSDIDHEYSIDALELDMKKLFRPISDVVESPVDGFPINVMATGV